MQLDATARLLGGVEPRIATARRNFADIVSRVIYRREPTIITKNGRQVTAAVPNEALALPAALEAEAGIEKASAAFAAIQNFKLKCYSSLRLWPLAELRYPTRYRFRPRRNESGIVIILRCFVCGR
jgi:prevent-host-death family protein